MKTALFIGGTGTISTAITRQYIYISSASAYQKPCQSYLITEDTPLENPYWQYSRDKILCEKLVRGLRTVSCP